MTKNNNEGDLSSQIQSEVHKEVKGQAAKGVVASNSR